MRKIKFRAWDKADRAIIEWEELKKLHCSLGYLNECEKTDARILMQYTGLKDKNGKEIYEGDVANDEWREEIGEVKYVDGSFVIVFSNVQEYLSECADSIEIIGNIYENSELCQPQ